TLVAKHWAAIEAGQPENAEHTSHALERLVKQIPRQDHDNDRIVFLRGFFTAQETSEVQEVAAVFALQYGYATEAVPVLEEIARTEGIGLIADDAALVLAEWHDQDSPGRYHW